MNDDLYCTIERDNDSWYKWPWAIRPSWGRDLKLAFTRRGAEYKAKRMIKKHRKYLAEIKKRNRSVAPYRYPK